MAKWGNTVLASSHDPEPRRVRVMAPQQDPKPRVPMPGREIPTTTGYDNQQRLWLNEIMDSLTYGLTHSELSHLSSSSKGARGI